MSGDALFVFILIGVASAMMASNRIRFDVVALLVVIALMLSGILSPREALSGFGSPVVILVAGLLVVGEMLDRTGIAAAIGDWILEKGGRSEVRLIILIMTGAAVLGAVMSSTAVVAIFIPIVLQVAAQTGLNASRILMPMSYAALISGMLTLIATPPNLVVSYELRNAGFSGLGFFSFTIVGLAVLGTAIVYILLVGRHLLPGPTPDARAGRPGAGRSLRRLWDDYLGGLSHRLVVIDHGSPLAGMTIGEASIGSRYDVRILGLQRRRRGGKDRITLPAAYTELRAGDTLWVVGDRAAQARLSEEQNATLRSLSIGDLQRWFWELGGAAVLVHPESRLVGKSLCEAAFRSAYGLHVIGIRRSDAALKDFPGVKLAAADSMLVVGPWSKIRRLQNDNHDFIVLEMPADHEQIGPARGRKSWALAILGAMVALSVFDIVPLVAAVIMAALAAVGVRCLSMERAYRAIPWSSLVLVAGMLPLADALKMTGGTDIIVDALLDGLGEAHPRLMMTVIFFLTATLGLFLSNTASAVLVAPIAVIAADKLGVSPYPMALAVLIAASAAFVTPVSTPVVTLVVAPGRYGFMDFVKVGSLLLLLTYAVTLLVVPLVFPFAPI